MTNSELNCGGEVPSYQKRDKFIVDISKKASPRMKNDYYSGLLKTVFDIDTDARDAQKNNNLINQLRRKLLADPFAYVESLGKADIQGFVGAEHSKKTAIRLVLGATTLMPYRSLSYAHSVLSIAKTIYAGQVQIVHANHVGTAINGIDIKESYDQARSYAALVREHAARHFPALEGRILHGVDTPMDTNQYTDLVQLALHEDEDNATRLGAKAEAHSGNAVRYGAAHYAFQDTDDLELEPLLDGAPQQIYADRIISVGGLQEKSFYKLRMGMQALQTPFIYTGQIFTKHVIPPYYTARDGEPSLHDGPPDDIDSVGDFAARRDIAHLLNITSQGEI